MAKKVEQFCSWCRNEPEEAELAKFGLEYEIVTIAVSEIDLKASENIQTRLSGTNEQLVAQYAWCIANPDVRMPMPFVWWRKSKYVVLSGKHRIGACLMAELKELPVYRIVSDKSDLCHDFARVVNSVNGAPEPFEDRITKAISMHQERGYPLEEVARMIHIRVNALRDAVRTMELRKKLQPFIPEIVEVRKSTMSQLNAVSDLDNVVIEAAKAVTQMGLTERLTTELTNDIKRQTSEEGKLEAIKKFRHHYRILDKSVNSDRHRVKQVAKNTVRDRVLSKMKDLEARLDEIESAQQIGAIGQGREVFVELSEQINNHFSRIFWGSGRD